MWLIAFFKSSAILFAVFCINKFFRDLYLVFGFILAFSGNSVEPDKSITILEKLAVAIQEEPLSSCPEFDVIEMIPEFNLGLLID